ncbi:MAG: hypothetical protein ACRD9R_05885 [Pyrinomonadaceae bacterium]
MHKTEPKICWRLGLCAALAMSVLALYPQLHLWYTRGRDWHGAYAYFYPDEPAYAAYVNALGEGRPRRNDPYTGRDDSPGAARPESIFSVQFIPAYALALPARVLNLSTPTVFILLGPLAAFAATLAVFWLLTLLTNDERLGACGAIFVLCLGVCVPVEGVLDVLLGNVPRYMFLPFLRRYEPSFPFPFFFAFCAVVWRALNGDTHGAKVKLALLAGFLFGILVFSYFFLWTAAAAWFVCLAALWPATRRPERRGGMTVFGIIGACGLVVLVPYFWLLSGRGDTVDSAQVLTLTRRPDLLRPVELIGYVVIVALALGARRGWFDWRGRAAIFTASFALLPLVVFNQHVLTGRSLQPFHYELYLANYAVLLGVVACVRLFWQVGGGRVNRTIPAFVLFAGAAAAFLWGAGETVLATRRYAAVNVMRDEALPVLRRLGQISREQVDTTTTTRDEPKVAFIADYGRADNLPTVASVPVLWAPHMFAFSGLSLEENRRRYLQQLYYSGLDAEGFMDAYAQHRLSVSALFGWGRALAHLSLHPNPPGAEEVRGVQSEYARFVASFTPELAKMPRLGYVVVFAGEPFDFSRLDRWYERDAGEQVGKYWLYRVRPRP